MLIDVQKVSALGAKQQVFLLLPDFEDSEDGEVKANVHQLREYFDPEFLTAQSLIVRTAQGRGTVYFFNLNNVMSVLRHYYRGGLVAKLVKDKFVFAGIQNTRAYQELKLLTYLYNAGVSVPKPIAAKITILGMAYRADIITRAIQGGEELHQLLQTHTVSDKVWIAIAHEVAKLHSKRACHDDLNVKNILVLPGEKVALLDFDACSVKRGERWKSSNLARFRRSLEKQQKKCASYHFNLEQWALFLDAYEHKTLTLSTRP